MIPPIFPILAAAPAVTALLGTSPTRIYPFGENTEKTVTYPYITWQLITGTPENYLGDRPDIDNTRVQIDCWGDGGTGKNGAASVNAVADAVRNVLEDHGYMVDFGSTERDPDTVSYRYRMDFEFWTHRG
jgi:hypothetical protein